MKNNKEQDCDINLIKIKYTGSNRYGDEVRARDQGGGKGGTCSEGQNFFWGGKFPNKVSFSVE